MHLELLQGEFFSGLVGANKNKCVINETYAKALGIDDNPLGKNIGDVDGVVIGMVKDFHFMSPNNPIEPRCLRYHDGYPGAVIYRSKSNILPEIKSIWKKILPNSPFLFRDLESSYSSQYLKDGNLFKILLFFTLLSIFISCLGVIGLIRYTCEKRLKEIGIRKVCGAKSREILSMINREFLKWVLISFVISCPIAWFIIDKWHETYAYKVGVGGSVFVMAGIFITVLSATMVSWLAWYWANRNPVEALRYEQ
jgi:putative ABC transport system permease protein